MIRTVFFFLFCLTSSISNAQDIIDLTKSVKCSEVESVITHFLLVQKETPVWVGKTPNNTHIALLTNKESKSWTMIEFDSRLACVLGVGEEKYNSIDIKL
jgi:hypothetical protein